MNNFTNISKLVFDLGGTGSLAKQLNIKPSTISNWKRNNKIPQPYHKKIYSIYLGNNLIIKNNDEIKSIDAGIKKTFKILMIISGGIACYKSLELIRIFKKMNFHINVILTNSAQKFITPLLITSLNGGKCFTDLFSVEDEENINHIKLARENDLVMVVPATANTLGKLANGIADDLASTVLLATHNKIVMAPAMNPFMWKNPACQDNVAKLKERGIIFLEPENGIMACGEEGAGRLTDIEYISDYILNEYKSQENKTSNVFFENSKLKNLHVIVTAGPTQELIDPIRFVSNNSSGKQGYAIADEFMRAGATVTLITGPTKIRKPLIHKIEEVTTAEQMLNSVLKNLPADIFVGAAAVSDWKLIPYKLENKQLNSKRKIKKTNLDTNCLIFKPEENPDILKTISFHNKRPKIVIGFAAETENLIENAKLKLNTKNADIIVANQIDKNNNVFDSDFNKVVILEKNKLKNYKKTNKQQIAKFLVDKIARNYI